MFVSVIVPVYNVELFLEECVQSILHQSCTDIEVILVDDGATDRSGEICDKLADLDGRIKVIHKLNGGLSSARNVGLDYATGEYVLFVDSDDWIDSDTVQCLKGRVQQDASADICCFRMAKVSNKNVSPIGGEFPLSELSSVDELIKECCVGGNIKVSACCKLYKRSFIESHNLRFVEGVINEDSIFVHNVITNLPRVIFENKILYYVRSNDNSISRNIKERNFTSLFVVAEHLDRIYRAKYLRSKYEHYLCAFWLKMCMYTLTQAAYRLPFREYKRLWLILKASKYTEMSICKIGLPVLPQKLQLVYKVSQYPLVMCFAMRILRLLGYRMQ